MFLAFGQICEIDASRGYVRVYLPETEDTTEFIPYVRDFAGSNSMSIPFEIDMQVIVGHTVSDKWFVLGATPNKVDVPYGGASKDKFGVKFSDGTLIEYDNDLHKLKVISEVASVEIQALSVKITAADIELIGAVAITGAITASSGLSLSG